MMSMKCPNCGAPTIELFTSRVCSVECDLKESEPLAGVCYADVNKNWSQTYGTPDKLPRQVHLPPKHVHCGAVVVASNRVLFVAEATGQTDGMGNLVVTLLSRA